VCGFIAASLGLRSSDGQKVNADLWEIGIATGNKRSQMLCLQANGGLALVVATSTMPLAEVIAFSDGQYSLDGAMIRLMVDAATTADKRYTPNQARREARKLDTQALHESWQKEYRKLKRTKPGMSDAWYAQQIAKMKIAQQRDPDTIRKNMKK
jgi:predicted patatin/cPLA2 family phospholipase